jgi:hypothetical protein
MSESERTQIIDQILVFPANKHTREFLDGPHPKTETPYTNAELREYLEELQREELYRQEQVSFEFLTRHIHDFNNCAANIGLMKDYFAEHRLGWTKENLEKAFLELKSKLAPVPGTAVNTTQPSAPEPPPPPVPAPVVQPAAEPLGLTMTEINSWDGPTMRRKMADPVTRKQIDRCLVAEAELLKLAREQDQR